MKTKILLLALLITVAAKAQQTIELYPVGDANEYVSKPFFVYHYPDTVPVFMIVCQGQNVSMIPGFRVDLLDSGSYFLDINGNPLDKTYLVWDSKRRKL